MWSCFGQAIGGSGHGEKGVRSEEEEEEEVEAAGVQSKECKGEWKAKFQGSFGDGGEIAVMKTRTRSRHFPGNATRRTAEIARPTNCNPQTPPQPPPTRTSFPTPRRGVAWRVVVESFSSFHHGLP